MAIRPADHGIFASSGGGAGPVAAYFAGGKTTTAPWYGILTINKFAFADDSRTTLAAGLSASSFGVHSLAGLANSAVAAYWAGGKAITGLYGTGSYTDVVDKFAFPDDSRTTLGTGLSGDRYLMGPAANSGVAGYFAGGEEASRVDTVDKFAFSDDSRSTLGTGLSSSRDGVAGAANSGVAAYFAGGYDHAATSRVSTVDKFAFSDDSRTTLGTGLSAARSSPSGAANSGVAAYFAGGSTGSYVTTVDKFAFSDDSRTSLGTGLSAGRSGLAGAANSGTAAYFAGGYGYVTTVDKFAFVDDGRTTLGTGLSTGVFYLAGAADSGVL